MNEPPGRRIVRCRDASGFPAIQWEVLPGPMRKTIGVILAGVACAAGYKGRRFPGEFWSLVNEARGGTPDWFGLGVTGVMTVGTVVAVIAFGGFALLILFRDRPERFVLAGSRLLYEPGSALLALGPGSAPDRRLLWMILRGNAGLEIQKDQFAGASVAQYRNQRYVLLEAGGRQYRVGQFLNWQEQRWLVETLEEWKRRG